MAENKYLFYSDFLKNQNINNKNILVAKTKSSYLVGPKINHKFDGVSFYKRIKSNCIYSPKIYKKMFKRKCVFLINKYAKSLKDNEVIEIFKNGETLVHKIIKVPGENL